MLHLSRWLWLVTLAVPSLALSEERAPRLHVLAVGVDSAVDEDQLGYYADDAEALGYLLRRPDISQYGHGGEVFILRGLDATVEKVLTVIQALGGATQANDTAVLVFSTHGGPNQETGEFELSLANGCKLSGAVLLTELAKLRGKSVIMIDACRAGMIVSQFDPSLHASISLLLASKSNEDSSGAFPQQKLRHGFFVNALREGLLGVADIAPRIGNRDESVDVSELGRYAARRVSEIYPRQTVLLYPESDLPKIPLVRYTPESLRLGHESIEAELFKPRNPWLEPDVPNAFTPAVRSLAVRTEFKPLDKDGNAAAWSRPTQSKTHPVNLEGNDWESRWRKYDTGCWNNGIAEIAIDGSTCFLRFSGDDDEDYLFEVRFLGNSCLAGRYHNVRRTLDDSGTWVGRFVDLDRIDGYYVGDAGDCGRWNFRRTLHAE